MMRRGGSVRFEDFFVREEDCLVALYKAKWPNGFRCPRCGHGKAFTIRTRRLPLYECTSCSKQTSLIAGTVLEGSRTTLLKWFRAIYWLSHQPYTNALQLSRIIEVTYKTSWLICHKIREAMTRAESERFLTGLVHVEFDELYKRCVPSFDVHHQEQPVIIGGSRNEQGEFDTIIIRHQSKAMWTNRFVGLDTHKFIASYVDLNAIVHAPPSTKRINYKSNIRLKRTNRELERWLAQTFLGIGPKHLQRYIDQFCYLYNRRLDEIWDQLVRICASTRVLKYPDLIARNPYARTHKGPMISSQVG
jgi:transposase-like protein